MSPSTVPFVDLDRIHEPLAAEIAAAQSAVLSRGDFILGKAVTAFEDEFADYCGTTHAIGVSSGTAALAIGMQAAGIGPGDEVIVPAHTYIASAFAVIHAGAVPVYCDVDPASGLVDLASAAEVCGPRTVAVMAVHLYGQCCDLESLERFCSERGLALVEDAAQAHGARWGERLAGSAGICGCFSFYPSKNLGALGDGGLIVTSDERVAAEARKLRNLGQESKGTHTVVGYNQRLSTMEAAVLRRKLPHLDDWNRSRLDAAGLYRQLLPEALSGLPERPEASGVFHLFPIRHRGREQLRKALGERGIQTGIHYFPVVHQHPALAAGAQRRTELTEAERWAAEELSLPIFAGITSAEVEAVAAAVTSATEGLVEEG